MMSDKQRDAAEAVMGEVLAERERQHERWGEQNHGDGTGQEFSGVAAFARANCDDAAARGKVTYRHILAEEFFEALAESDPARLRAELIQVAAVAVAWVEAIDRRAK